MPRFVRSTITSSIVMYLASGSVVISCPDLFGLGHPWIQSVTVTGTSVGMTCIFSGFVCAEVPDEQRLALRAIKLIHR